MLVKTPAIKLGVEVRDSRVEDGRLVLSGVANAMPCTVEIGGKELIRLAAKLMRPAVIGLVLRSIFAKAD
ncbi:MAG: hypothetical protein KA233_03445 [Novosphingobium sp.]|jgi:hypothetical protein|nr:hypothetical protein [Novosphingobium sp.]